MIRGRRAGCATRRSSLSRSQPDITSIRLATHRVAGRLESHHDGLAGGAGEGVLCLVDDQRHMLLRRSPNLEHAAQRGAIDLPTDLGHVDLQPAPCNALAMHFDQRQPWEVFYSLEIIL